MGSIRRAPRSDRWEARYRDPAGRQRSQTFDRKTDAQAFLAAVATDARRGEWIDPASARVVFDDFVTDVFVPTLNGLEPSTRARDLSFLRTHVRPAFGTWQIGAIDWASCQAWVNDIAGRRSPATTRKAAQIMSKIMKAAVRARLVAHNPMAEVVLPTVEESEDVYLTPAQVRDLADAMEQVAPQYRALVMLGCYAGPRIGELAALRWSDVDLLRRTVSITKKVIEVSGHGLVEGSTKTKAGRRSVTIPRLVADELERHRGVYTTGAPGDLVFTDTKGGPLRANNLRRREWPKAVVLAGLDPPPTFHDMRHTAVSLWIAAGASDLEVAKWAGHRSVSFTKDRYAHLFPEHGEALADRLDAFIASATPTPAAATIRLHR